MARWLRAASSPTVGHKALGSRCPAPLFIFALAAYRPALALYLVLALLAEHRAEIKPGSPLFLSPFAHSIELNILRASERAFDNYYVGWQLDGPTVDSRRERPRPRSRRKTAYTFSLRWRCVTLLPDS